MACTQTTQTPVLLQTCRVCASPLMENIQIAGSVQSSLPSSPLIWVVHPSTCPLLPAHHCWPRIACVQYVCTPSQRSKQRALTRHWFAPWMRLDSLKKRLLYCKPVRNAPILAATYQAVGTVHTVHLVDVWTRVNEAGRDGDEETQAHS